MNPIAPTRKQAQIIRKLRGQILDGTLKPGARMPTHVELTDRFGVSSVTVQRALDRLRFDGFVVPRGRRGTFVAEAPPHLTTCGLVVASVHGSSVPGKYPASRFAAAMVTTALSSSERLGRRFEVYSGVAPRTPDAYMERLMTDIQARRIGGLIFINPNITFAPEMAAHRDVPCVGYVPAEGRPEMSGFVVNFPKLISRALERFASEGRRRVGMITLPNMGRSVIDHFRNQAQARGLQTHDRWLVGLEPSCPHWAANVVQMMLHGPADERPDALLIADEHFVTAAAQGVVASGVPFPDALSIIGHCSYPTIAASALPVARLGYDIRSILRVCLDLIDRQRAGEDIPKTIEIPALFGEEVNPYEPY